MSAELCNNVSKYDGVKYGYRTPNYETIDQLYTNSRTEAFGYLTKSVVLFGSETLSEDNYFKVYDKAQRIRRVICEALAKVFSEFDAILAPVSSKLSYTAEEAMANPYMAYEESLYTAPAMISGIPAVVTDGVQLMGAAFSESSLLALAEKL
jgi:aspartyl-tRNA(Asn)/glutamyl-tRNA(Gln) amidotransferase subunit A